MRYDMKEIPNKDLIAYVKSGNFDRTSSINRMEERFLEYFKLTREEFVHDYMGFITDSWNSHEEKLDYYTRLKIIDDILHNNDYLSTLLEDKQELNNTLKLLEKRYELADRRDRDYFGYNPGTRGVGVESAEIWSKINAARKQEYELDQRIEYAMEIINEIKENFSIQDLTNRLNVIAFSQEDFAMKPWQKAVAVGAMGLGLAGGMTSCNNDKQSNSSSGMYETVIDDSDNDIYETLIDDDGNEYYLDSKGKKHYL